MIAGTNGTAICFGTGTNRSFAGKSRVYRSRSVVHYIHLNPLRAEIVTDLEELKRYRYSGRSAVMGKE